VRVHGGKVARGNDPSCRDDQRAIALELDGAVGGKAQQLGAEGASLVLRGCSKLSHLSIVAARSA
jgi:hypothetical protein